MAQVRRLCRIDTPMSHHSHHISLDICFMYNSFYPLPCYVNSKASLQGFFLAHSPRLPGLQGLCSTVTSLRIQALSPRHWNVSACLSRERERGRPHGHKGVHLEGTHVTSTHNESKSRGHSHPHRRQGGHPVKCPGELGCGGQL